MYFAAELVVYYRAEEWCTLQRNIHERRFAERFKSKRLKITASNRNKLLQVLTEILQNNNLKISSFLTDKTDEDYTILFSFEEITKSDLAELVNNLHGDPDIKEVIWNK
ncbi:ACT domain-containing protein [Arcticibacter sp. MXS-1]|uniref:ACT domain-containing protein n=1 Tax=Arcticibacter sp. MXS-1 TaxID=3341726 RepID=UPI0035A8AFA8